VATNIFGGAPIAWRTSRMGCAGSKEPNEPRLSSNREASLDVDNINVVEKPALERKKSAHVRAASADAARTHGASRASPRTHATAARAGCTVCSDCMPTRF